MKDFAKNVLALILAVSLGYATPLVAQVPPQQQEPPAGGAGDELTRTIPYDFLRTIAEPPDGNLAPPEAEWICRSHCYADLGAMLALLRDLGLEIVDLSYTYSNGGTFQYDDGSFESFWLLEGTVTVKGSAADVEFVQWMLEIGLPVL